MARTSKPNSTQRRIRDNPALRAVAACALRCAVSALEASMRAKPTDDNRFVSGHAGYRRPE